MAIFTGQVAMLQFQFDDQLETARLVRHGRRAGRLRLQLDSLAGDRRRAARVERVARSWPGVEEVRADPRSGRLLIRYAPDAPLLRELEAPSRRPARVAAGAELKAQHQQPWHALSVDEVAARLRSSAAGLDDAVAGSRLQAHGPNLVEMEETRSRLALLRSQVANAPMAMLGGSAGASALLGDLIESTAILVVVGLNAGIGYQIERRNERVITSWRQLEAGVVPTIRGAELREIPASELVPGDVILVRAGDRVPADARVLEAHRLVADEAALSGESEPQPKNPAAVAEDAPLAERHSMLYAGTSVAGGHGRALVVATGRHTEMARIRNLVETSAAPPPPLAARMEKLSREVGTLAFGAAALSTTASLLHGKPVAQVLRSAVALGVAALPEGLPIVATSALLRSMQRLHDHGIVVRRMAAAEALGAVTVICADKTGTLTRNEMHLEILEIGGRPIELKDHRADQEKLFEDPVALALSAALLNSDVDVVADSGELELSGSATERALVQAAIDIGLDGKKLRKTFPRRELQERTRQSQWVESLHDAPGGGTIAFLKGAPDQVLARCDREGGEPMRRDRREEILARNEALAADGLRVLALAYRRQHEESFDFLGLVALRDPLREGAAETIERGRAAGIRTLILTGDQRPTAEAIARSLDLRGETLAASDLAGLSPEGLAERLHEVAVLARIAPEDKLAIVRALRTSGEIVAMAGDGINDAPALKAADVGIAVGAGAADLARQVADVVMSGDDLRSILAAVGEGRIVQDNLRRALRFLFATNLSELGLMLGASLVGAREPLNPMQLLWINLLTDTLPGLALALEPGEPDVLDRPPPPSGSKVLRREDLRDLGRDALGLAGIGAAGLAIGGPPLAFTTLTAAQLSYAAVCRAGHVRFGRESVEADRRFAQMMAGGVALQVGAVTFPPLRRLLGLPVPGPLIFAGIAAGLALPRLAHDRHRGVIVRRGRPALPKEMHA